MTNPWPLVIPSSHYTAILMAKSVLLLSIEITFSFCLCPFDWILVIFHNSFQTE